jgi:hypothetical protein
MWCVTCVSVSAIIGGFVRCTRAGEALTLASAFVCGPSLPPVLFLCCADSQTIAMKAVAIVVCLLGLSIVAAEMVAPKAISDVDAEWTEAEYAEWPAAAFVETESESEAESEGISHTIAGRHGMVTYISPGHRINSGIAYSAPACKHSPFAAPQMQSKSKSEAQAPYRLID